MYRKRVVVIIISIVVYILLLFIQTKISKSNLIEVYVLKNDINRKTKVTVEDVEKVKVENKFSSNILTNIDYNNMVAKTNLNKGQILYTSSVLSDVNVEEIKPDKECVNIKLDNSEMTIDKLSKDSVVNVYYTGRTSQVKNFFNEVSLKKIESSSITDGYTTVLLLKEVDVKNVYNKEGKLIDGKSNDSFIFSIDVEVVESQAMLIQNIVNFGKFNVTLKR